MNLSPLGLTTAMVAAGVPTRRAVVNAVQLLAACRLASDQGGRLVALWLADERDLGRGFCLRVVLQDDDGLTLLEHPMVDGDVAYPDLAPMFPAANRMQRAAYDLVGIPADGDDQRPWLRHASWPADQFPLRRDFAASNTWPPQTEDYAFVKVEGDGVHEIPVGPVHAGTIEPGHFRFQVVGEKVLRLEERLGFTHKGIEKRFEDFALADGYRLAGRVSGDSTVAYAWAYAQAVEAIAEVTVPERATWLRALCLERERIASHLGDLGFLGNDAGLAFGLAQFSRLREDVLRVNRAAFGHRLLMDVIVPGGVAVDVTTTHVDEMRAQGATLAQEIRVLHGIYDEHAGLQDRFRNCGRVTPLLAVRLGLIGLAGRASGQAHDLRCDFPCAPYATLDPRKSTAAGGDVAARVAVRFGEVAESLRLVAVILDALADTALAGPALTTHTHVPLPRIPEFKLGIGLIEGWRGPVLVALTSGPGGTIRRCHPQDPSWANWPVLEHAIIDDIVADFPLINKSFNLSYSGHDL